MDIGAKIKRIRLSNQLTLEELANRSELTKGFLSQLERDLTSPSVATLENLLEALGTNLKDFFSEDEDEQIVGYVIQGKVTLVHGEEEYEVKKGETFYLKGNLPHYLMNKNDTLAKVIWVSTPPIF